MHNEQLSFDGTTSTNITRTLSQGVLSHCSSLCLASYGSHLQPEPAAAHISQLARAAPAPVLTELVLGSFTISSLSMAALVQACPAVRKLKFE